MEKKDSDDMCIVITLFWPILGIYYGFKKIGNLYIDASELMKNSIKKKF